MIRFQGIYPALVTPFTVDGRVDADAVQKLTASLKEKGVNGFYVSGSTGESYMLSVEERKFLLEAVKEAAGEEMDVIVNIGMFATVHSLELARHAEKCGASAVSSVPPFYFPFTKEEYRDYYNDLAQGVDIPVIIYNIPAMSSVQFSTEELNQMLKNEKIEGIKHTSYDLFQMQQLIAANPQKSIFIGHDEIFLSALSAGAQAGIGSTYNIMADKFTAMSRLFAERKMEQALRIQNEVNEIITVLNRVGIFKGIKEILKMQGYSCGDCRKPFQPLSIEQKTYLHRMAEKYQLA